jgi:hypothetical protein
MNIQIAGYSNGKIIVQATYVWNADSQWFSFWFEFSLMLNLSPKSIIILDNASFHSKAHLSVIALAYWT